MYFVQKYLLQFLKIFGFFIDATEVNVYTLQSNYVIRRSRSTQATSEFDLKTFQDQVIPSLGQLYNTSL
jgi:hypothetical protein